MEDKKEQTSGGLPSLVKKQLEKGRDISMKRIILMVICQLIHIPKYFWQFHKFNSQDQVPYEEAFIMLKNLCKNCSRVGRVRVHEEGVENIPLEGGCLLTPNHQGLFDGLAFLETSSRNLAIVFKHEVKDIILLKQVMKMTGSLPINREDIKQSMRVIMEATELVKKGRMVLVFPEGTRSKEELNEFKGGSFKIAQKAKAPIIPCAVIDSYKVFDTKSIKFVDVYIKYLPAIQYEEYKDMSTVDIADMVKTKIETVIAEHRRKFGE